MRRKLIVDLVGFSIKGYNRLFVPYWHSDMDKKATLPMYDYH
jgi:hypothetical protein